MARLSSIVEKTARPITFDVLVEGLRSLGLAIDANVLVHASLSKIGWIPGGAQTLIEALLEVVGSGGTVVMPTFSTDLTDPKDWHNPPVPEKWWTIVRDNLPAYDPLKTPTRGVGIVSECFRSWPGAIRSKHPHTSFAARGANAELITNTHALASPLGGQSPLAILYNLDASVLFLGTGFATNSCFHLAEDNIPNMPLSAEGAPLMNNGGREWVRFHDNKYDSSDFEECGAAFESSENPKRGKIGSASCYIFSIRSAVQFARTWLPHNRK